MTKPRDNHIFLIIGDKAFTLEDLGPAADMRIDHAMQSIIDQGLIGEDIIGRPWFEIIKSSNLKLESEPPEADELNHALYMRYNDALKNCKELSRKGELTDAHKGEVMQFYKEWKAAEKLSKL